MPMRHSQGLRRKTSLRLLIGGLAALVAGPAIAQSCVQPAERTAFDIRALQSQLMVAALACNQDAAYNAFVRRYQNDLASAYRGVQGHFRRTAGGSHQRELNAHSQEQIRAGSQYCPMMLPMFTMANALPGGDALATFSRERNVLNPLTTSDCATAAPAATPARSAPARQRQASR